MIHAAQGETLSSITTGVSQNDSNFRLWGSPSVGFIKTNQISKYTIFVGSRLNKIGVLRNILAKKKQWCNYIEHYLELITITSTVNSESIPQIKRSTNQTYNTFIICDVPLPQCGT